MVTEDEHPHGATVTLSLPVSSAAGLAEHPALPRPVQQPQRRRETLAGYALPGRQMAVLLPLQAAPPVLAPLQPGEPIPPAPPRSFVAELETTEFALQPAPGTTVAATLRTGRLQSGRAAATVCQLELTAREGDPAAPWQLALALHRAEPLRLEAESLAARGLRLQAGTPPMPRHASDPGLHPRITLGGGLRRIVLAGVAQMLANEPAILHGHVEGVHQMRVAVRQLRAGLRLFAPLLAEAAATPFDTRLRALGHVLGEARDWDVFCTETLPALAAWHRTTPPAGQDPGALATAATSWRGQTHAALMAELASPQPTALGLELAAWAHGRPLPDAALTEHASALLHPLARRLRRRGHHLRRLAPEGLHDLRKALKALRYATDFLGPLFPQAAVHRYVKRCKALQSVLGDINDAAMTGELATRLEDADDLRAWNEQRRQDAMPALGRAWERMREAEPYWA